MGPALLFAIWLGIGVWQWRRGRRLLVRLRAIRPTYRKVWGTLLLAGSAALLLGGLFLLASSNPGGAFRVVDWLVIAVLGAIFVYSQTMAAAMLVSLGDFGVTSSASAASTTRIHEGK